VAKIANVALTNTFDFWRGQTNIVFDRLSQFAINNNRLYSNTIVANNVLKSLGNTVLGASGKRAVVNGLLSANGRMTISTNLDVTGNTAANKATVTSALTVSSNTTLGAAGKTITSTGAASHTGTATISTNLTVSGNTSLSAGASNTFINFNGARLTNYSEYANSSVNTGSSISVSDNTNFARYTVTASTTVTLPTNSTNPGASPAVKTLVLFFKQNGTGGYTVTLAAATGGTIIYNNSASQPAVNTTANKRTIYHCMKFDNDNAWYVSQSFIDA